MKNKKRTIFTLIAITLIAFVIIQATAPTFRIFPYGVRFIGDLQVDSTIYINERTSSSSDSAVVIDGGILKYNTSLGGGSGDTALWGRNGAYIYSLPATTRVGIGTGPTPMTRLHIIDSTGSGSFIYQHSYGETAGLFSGLTLVHTNGTGPSSYDALADNSGLGVINFGGSYNTSSGVATSASIWTQTSELWDGSGRGTEVHFKTAKNNATTVDTRMWIDGEGNVNVGTSSGDSTFNVIEGMTVGTDILVAGGWASWSPTYTWTGGTPASPTTETARYQVVNNTVTFSLYISGTNDSGFALTRLQFTGPETPSDVNGYALVNCAYVSPAGNPINGTRLTAGVDMLNDTPSNRQIGTASSVFSISNEATYTFVFTGQYEISSK